MPDWYKWKSIEDFNTWHEYVKKELGIPHPNRSLSTGRVRASSAHWTLEYTEPTIVAEDDIRAIVEEKGLSFPNLGEPCDPPPRPPFEMFMPQQDLK